MEHPLVVDAREKQKLQRGTLTYYTMLDIPTNL